MSNLRTHALGNLLLLSLCVIFNTSNAQAGLSEIEQKFYNFTCGQ